MRGNTIFIPGTMLITMLIVISTFFPSHLMAQRNCGTAEYQELLLQQNRGQGNILEFEEWLKSRVEEKRSSNAFRLLSVKEPVLQIPVVVHVVHNGEPYGSGSNITDEQISSQIAVLNEDFRRLNADASETLPIFTPVASDTEIEFVMAKQDPEGLPTTGIIRLQGTDTVWNMNQDRELKSLSYWPAEDYLNIWVTTLGGGLLGYAQLPVSNLEGLEDSSNNRLTDGMVIGYNYFGSIDKYPGAVLEAPYNLGRTTTHEMGHFLGLRHVWGDCGCSCDDFVDDTPIQENSTNGCPETKQSCGSQDMFQNYMDYTDDQCMNIFTELQKERMRIILDSSPRRASLTVSHALNEPIEVATDLGIREIIDPSSGICTPTLNPTIEVRNYGSNIITSTTIELWINEIFTEEITPAISLSALESETLVFSEVVVPASGEAEFEFRIVEVNGAADENPNNDIVSNNVLIPVFEDLPVDQSFEIYPSTWSIKNEDNEITWQHTQVPSRTPDNNAMFMNFQKYERIGALDFLITPQMDLSGFSNAYLLFDYAYAHTPGLNNDEFRIAISDDCGESFTMTIYSRKGASLGTTDETTLPFIPSDRSDWKRESININQFTGDGGIQIAFIAINGGGNNLYVDNVQIVGNDFTDVAIHSLASPGYIYCSDNAIPVLTLENLGTTDIDDIEITYTIDSGNETSRLFSNLNFGSGNQLDLQLDPLPDQTGEFELDFQVSTSGDSDLENNTYSLTIHNSCLEEVIPFREGFDDIETGEFNWIIYNKDDDGIAWQKDIPSSAIVLENFNAPLMGLRDYIFSPVIDISQTNKASMFFDVSYATIDDPGELLRIRVSSDNGLSYEDLIYEQTGADLSITNSSAPWVPGSDLDWIREFIDLSIYAGQKIILAFEATGMASNNLYIDNLEFYEDDNPEPFVFETPLRIYPNPSQEGKFNVTFNIQQKEDVMIRVFDVLGNEIFRREYPGTLNQTIPFDFTGNKDGIYLMRTTSPSINTTDRIFINPRY